MSKFVHLHTHSHYSLLEALPFVDELAKRAKKQGSDAVALTDNGNLFGTIEFVQECEKAGVKPIIGLDAYVALDTLHDKRHRIDDKSYRLVLLAENMEGYKNLMKLSSIGYIEGFYYRPRIDRNVLRQHSKGLIALSGGRSDVARLMESSETDKANERLAEYLDIFGRDNFFFELQYQPDAPEQKDTNDMLLKLAREHDVKVVAGRAVYYLDPDDAEGRKLLLCIKDQRTIEDRDRTTAVEPDFSMTPPEEIEEAFKDIPGAIDNVRAIADRCNVKLELGKWNFPVFEIPDGKTADEHLHDISYAGLEKLLKRPPNEEETKRLDYELDIVKVKGYATYFLVVADYTSWAREQGIISTTRGSAAGSLMGFAIGISTVNPLDFKLPFERFLNPLRPSAPDIDMDFADNRRGEVLDYVKKKYGVDRVAQICTFGTMAARGSVKDAGRALGYPPAFCDSITKLIPFGAQGFAMTLERALNEAPDFKAKYDNDPQVRRMVELAMKIEGRARQCSVHAAGVVISDKPLIEYTPLQKDSHSEGNIITQYEMNSVESAGVLKMDFLGIRNLSILGNAIELVKRTKNVEVDLYHMPLNDEKTFKMLAEGKTMGLFQLNGDGMTKWLVQLKPSNIFDIMAMVALFRPGPMETIPEFIRRKHNPKSITYLDPRMKDYLQASYGCLVYQDDVLLTAINLAGYDWLEADKLRKAMGKKIPAEMAAQEKKFKDGVVKNGSTQSMADKLWDLIKPFAAYGFNKAHAASYGIVAYQTAYMKANYPAEYMTALMTAESDDLDKVAEAVAECRKMGIEVTAPDINESRPGFTYVDDNHIRFGLNAIKNLGEDTIRSIIEERKKAGKFLDLADFAARIQGKAFNKKSLEAMAKSGAMNSLGERNQIVDNLDILVAYNKSARKDAEGNQTNLFAYAVPAGESTRPQLSLRHVPPARLRDVLAWEKELLGLYVSAHPFGETAKEFGDLLEPISDALKKPEKANVRVGGALVSVKQITTKNGEPMLFCGLEDLSGKTEVIVFPSVFRDNGSVWQDGALLAVTGRISKKDNESKIIAERGWSLTQETIPIYMAHFRGEVVTSDTVMNAYKAPKSEGGEVHLFIPSKLPQAAIDALKVTIAKFPGKSRICLQVRNGDAVQKIETSFLFEPMADALRALETHVGMGNVKVLAAAAPTR
jgi:DNA polymerase-3 subunit alpha